MSSLLALQSTDLILHVLREFQDEEITNYEGSVDALRDLETVNQELMLTVSV